ncbi:hypothetical protein JCM19232_3529 [Vibrio ishigakensis]|uniref:Metal-dependent phosphohydrolase n=1 Tax=Vibrio ishigakensis TaxID=1481914 RepID=A0A0B8P7Q2_9VIBR|nr:hypothetical protein JCM19232_3529 [Vibrio ishigakensis]
MEELFSRYKHLIGDDYLGYRNHVYRTITYAMHFLGNDPELEQIVETAFVYHDIGLWTDHELAYLEPSEAVARETMKSSVGDSTQMSYKERFIGIIRSLLIRVLTKK